MYDIFNYVLQLALRYREAKGSTPEKDFLILIFTMYCQEQTIFQKTQQISLIYVLAKGEVIKRAYHHYETLSNYVRADTLRDNKVSISDKLLDIGETTA